MNQHNPRNSFAWVPAALVFVSLECLGATQALSAYSDNFFTVSQMKSIPVAFGLPFLWHFGMWGDFFIISPIAGYLVGKHAHRWRLPGMLISLMIGISSASILSWVYTFSTLPDSLVQNHHLTAAGIVHLLYMAVAVAVLIQFFLFTSTPSLRLLRMVSILVLFHVFIGTHMALGILKGTVPLGWYPGEPLKSTLGWVMVGAVGLGLLWRNLKLDSVFHDFSLRTAKQIAHWFMYWRKQDIYSSPRDFETPTGLLKLYDSLGGHLLELGFFLSVVARMWQRYASPGSDWITHLSHALPSCFLVLLFASIYGASRRSAKVELAISGRLFCPGRVPKAWSGSEDPLRVSFSVLFYFLLYMFLAWFAYNIYLVSAVILALACIDFNTRRLINKTVSEYFANDMYACQEDDKDRAVVQKRRAVISQYLFDLPHLWKEAGRVAGCLVALGFAAGGYFGRVEWLKSAAYLTLIGTLVINEIVTFRWRIQRDRLLRAVEAES
jgi:hypothetical protein